MSESFPFLFYGRRPPHWYEGANDGHVYELLFQNATSAAERTAIADAFEKSTAHGPVLSSSKPWLWSDRHALFFVGETSTGRFDAFFDGIERCVRAIHHVAPLAEVRFLGSQARGDTPWDKWTLERQDVPSPGPLYPSLSLRSIHREERSEVTPPPAEDPAFEETRRTARQAADRKKAIARAKPKPEKPAAAGLAAKLKKLKELRPNPSKELEPIFASDVAGAQAHPSGRIVGLVVAEPKTYRIGIHDADGKRYADLPSGDYAHLALHTDGKRALVCNTTALWEIDLASGATRSLHLPAISKLSGVAYAAGDRIAVLAGYPPVVHLLARHADALTLLVSEACPDGFSLGATRGGRVLVATSTSKYKTLLFVTDGTALRKVAFGRETTSSWSAEGDRLFLHGVAGSWEVTNLDEILAS